MVHNPPFGFMKSSTNMPKITTKEEALKDERIKNILNLWKKYFSDKMSVCTDCGGWTTMVCEKVMRDFIGAIIGNFDRTTDRAVSAAYEKGHANGYADGAQIHQNSYEAGKLAKDTEWKERVKKVIKDKKRGIEPDNGFFEEDSKATIYQRGENHGILAALDAVAESLGLK